jgi:hypothetical protein
MGGADASLYGTWHFADASVCKRKHVDSVAIAIEDII